MPFFIEFLKTSGRFDAWVEDCPLQYQSPNATAEAGCIGTILLSVLAGHWRYAHMNAIRGDGVNPELLGMTKVASEDSVRRAMTAMEEQASEQWMKKHLQASYEPLLEEPWALDMDTTVKPLYGHQEDAKVGDNPQARAAFPCLSQLFHREPADGVGGGGTGGKSDRVVVCATGVVVVVWTGCRSRVVRRFCAGMRIPMKWGTDF